MGETVTKDTIVFKTVGIIRNLITVALDLRASCRITELIDDLSLFCSKNCESKRIIGRLTKNLTILSNISQDIVNMIYGSKKETNSIIEEVE